MKRRRALFAMAGALLTPALGRSADPAKPERRWFEAADAMRRLAESWGDQSYGAVLVAGSAVIGEGPSRDCERAAAEARVERMIYGAALSDAGKPRR